MKTSPEGFRTSWNDEKWWNMPIIFPKEPFIQSVEKGHMSEK
jgi:hypothetical protein